MTREKFFNEDMLSENMSMEQIFKAWRGIIDAVEIVQVAVLNRLDDDKDAPSSMECEKLQVLNEKLSNTLENDRNLGSPVTRPAVEGIKEDWREIYDGIFALEEDVHEVLEDGRPKSEEKQEYLRNLARTVSRIIRVIEEEEE